MAHTLPHWLLFVLLGCYLCCSVVICVVLYIVCKCVLPPGDNPIAVNKYIDIIHEQPSGAHQIADRGEN